MRYPHKRKEKISHLVLPSLDDITVIQELDDMRAGHCFVSSDFSFYCLFLLLTLQSHTFLGGGIIVYVFVSRTYHFILKKIMY